MTSFHSFFSWHALYTQKEWIRLIEMYIDHHRLWDNFFSFARWVKPNWKSVTSTLVLVIQKSEKERIMRSVSTSVRQGRAKIKWKQNRKACHICNRKIKTNIEYVYIFVVTNIIIIVYFRLKVHTKIKEKHNKHTVYKRKQKLINRPKPLN